MPKSRNKYSRARRRERGRRTRHQRSSRWFYIAIAAILIVGVAGVVIASGGSESNAAPQIGDHWHAAFGVNICGRWLSNPATFESPAGNSGVRAGIHTHGDGFIHIHPFANSETGNHATLGKFMSYGGWSVSEDSLSVWEGPDNDSTKTTWKNGDKCPSESGQPGKGKPGEVVFEVNCKTVTGNPSDHKLADQEVVAIGFVPKGDEIGPPPNAASAPSNDSGTATQPKAIDQKECRPSATNNPGIPDTVPSATTAPSTTSSSTP